MTPNNSANILTEPTQGSSSASNMLSKNSSLNNLGAAINLTIQQKTNQTRAQSNFAQLGAAAAAAVVAQSLQSTFQATNLNPASVPTSSAHPHSQFSFPIPFSAPTSLIPTHNPSPDWQYPITTGRSPSPIADMWPGQDTLHLMHQQNPNSNLVKSMSLPVINYNSNLLNKQQYQSKLATSQTNPAAPVVPTSKTFPPNFTQTNSTTDPYFNPMPLPLPPISPYTKLKLKTEKFQHLEMRHQQMPVIKVENLNFYSSIDDQSSKAGFLDPGSTCTGCPAMSHHHHNHHHHHHHHHQAFNPSNPQSTCNQSTLATVAMNIAKLLTNPVSNSVETTNVPNFYARNKNKSKSNEVKRKRSGESDEVKQNNNEKDSVVSLSSSSSIKSLNSNNKILIKVEDIKREEVISNNNVEGQSSFAKSSIELKQEARDFDENGGEQFNDAKSCSGSSMSGSAHLIVDETSILIEPSPQRYNTTDEPPPPPPPSLDKIQLKSEQFNDNDQNDEGIKDHLEQNASQIDEPMDSQENNEDTQGNLIGNKN